MADSYVSPNVSLEYVWPSHMAVQMYPPDTFGLITTLTGTLVEGKYNLYLIKRFFQKKFKIPYCRKKHVLINSIIVIFNYSTQISIVLN